MAPLLFTVTPTRGVGIFLIEKGFKVLTRRIGVCPPVRRPQAFAASAAMSRGGASFGSCASRASATASSRPERGARAPRPPLARDSRARRGVAAVPRAPPVSALRQCHRQGRRRGRRGRCVPAGCPSAGCCHPGRRISCAARTPGTPGMLSFGLLPAPGQTCQPDCRDNNSAPDPVEQANSAGIARRDQVLQFLKV